MRSNEVHGSVQEQLFYRHAGCEAVALAAGCGLMMYIALRYGCAQASLLGEPGAWLLVAL